MQSTMTRVRNEQDSPVNLAALITKVKDLPPMPVVVMRAMEMCLDPNASIRNLQLVISQDQALSAKILRIVNSAMYSLRREVSTVSHAVAVLGLETVKSVIMAASVDGVLRNAKDLGTKLMSDHSWGTAIAARAVARRVRYENVEEAMICGLMHDIGKPVLLQNVHPQYCEIISGVYSGNGNFHQSELLTFGFSHAHVGAMLARKWNFPQQLAEAVGYHHSPLTAPSFRQLSCIVNLADLMTISMGIGFEKNKNLVLEKQPAAEFLKLNQAALAGLTTETKLTIQATANLK